MRKVKGIYDGTNVVLLDPLPIPPQTTVEVLISEEAMDMEQAYWQRLCDLGLIKQVRPQPVKEQPFTPVRVTGEPVSQTIIEGRR